MYPLKIINLYVLKTTFDSEGDWKLIHRVIRF
jgi:hypothetical protein